MTVQELEYNKKYKIKGSGIAVYKYQERKKFWFTNINGSFWMTEDQVTNLVLEESK